MIGTELLKGQGLGNQLFCYITARCIALDKGEDFAILNGDVFRETVLDDQKEAFIDLDMGAQVGRDAFKNVYHEKEDRLFLGNSKHDYTYGAYITGVDNKVFEVESDTLIQGNMQAEEYFSSHIADIKEWFRVKENFETYEYSRDNLCIINMRGGEYTGSPELFLQRKYWQNGIKYMKSIREDMEFMIITDDVASANKMLPGIEAHHFNVAKDFVVLKNAKYLLLSNSSFACIPAFISEERICAVAPKYWARHNVSDGYWASEQNIYSIFKYIDRAGRVYTAEECKKELEDYKQSSRTYKRVNCKPSQMTLVLYRIKSVYLYKKYRAGIIARGVMRRVKKLVRK